MSASISQLTVDSNSVLPAQLIGNFPDASTKILNYQRQQSQCIEKENQELHTFTEQWQIQPLHTNATGRNSINAISRALVFWCKSSPYRCENCNVIIYRKFMPTFMKMTLWKNKQPCHCLTQRYIVPHVADIPDCLKNLTKADILALRPFDLDCGIYQRHQTGYRLKKGIIKISCFETFS